MPEEIKQSRTNELFAALEKLPIYKEIIQHYLTDFIYEHSYASKQILSWIETRQIISSDDCIKIAEEVNKRLQKQLEEQQSKQREEKARAKWQNGTNPELDYHSMNALHRVARRDWFNEMEYNVVLDTLKRHPEYLHQKNNQGRTPLMEATYHGNIKLMLIFLSWGAKVHVKDISKYRPRFFKAVYTCDHEFDPDACIPGKIAMDEPRRSLLAALEKLEKKYLNQNKPYFTFEEVKETMVELLNKKEFFGGEILRNNAICGYIINNLEPSQRRETFDFLNEYYKANHSCELTSDMVHGALSDDYFVNQPTKSFGMQ